MPVKPPKQQPKDNPPSEAVVCASLVVSVSLCMWWPGWALSLALGLCWHQQLCWSEAGTLLSPAWCPTGTSLSEYCPYGITELLMLEKSLMILNCYPSTAKSTTQPCLQVPHLHISKSLQRCGDCLGQPAPHLDTSFGEETFLNIRSKPSWWNVRPLPLVLLLASWRSSWLLPGYSLLSVNCREQEGVPSACLKCQLFWNCSVHCLIDVLLFLSTQQLEFLPSHLFHEFF